MLLLAAMKTLFLQLAFLCIALSTPAQVTRISGRLPVPGSLQLILLNGDGHYNVPSIEIQKNRNGTFKQDLFLEHPLFALLKAGNRQWRVLLSPDRDLYIDTTGFSGSAAPENRLLQQIPFRPSPFFMQEEFAKTTAAEWQYTVMDKVEKDLQDITTTIHSSGIPSSLRQLLISEAGYAYQCYLNDLANNNMARARNPDRDSLLQYVMAWKPQPDSIALISGFYANMITERRSSYALHRVLQDRSGDPRQKIAAYLQTPFTVIDSLIKRYGERYILTWLYAQHHLPHSLQDKVLYNKILDAISGGDFNGAFLLSDTLQHYYPQSVYLAQAKAETKRIRNTLQAHANNPQIIFRKPGSVQSLADLVKPYAGKVVYLDIWGTWCGPCKEEMQYEPALKKQFKNKDIVFLYLDMDDAVKDNTWKEYLRFHSIEGQHYRMNRQEINVIWQEIEAAGGKINSYPTFVLFDRSGKIIQANAKRPSEQAALYQQLNEALR